MYSGWTLTTKSPPLATEVKSFQWPVLLAWWLKSVAGARVCTALIVEARPHSTGRISALASTGWQGHDRSTPPSTGYQSGDCLALRQMQHWSIATPSSIIAHNQAQQSQIMTLHPAPRLARASWETTHKHKRRNFRSERSEPNCFTSS